MNAGNGEDSARNEGNMSDELRFFILLLEKYAYDRNRPTGDVLREWDDRGITQEIYDGYFQYHQEAIENACADIDSLMTTGRHAAEGDGL